MQKISSVSVTVHTLGGDPLHPTVQYELERLAERLAALHNAVVNIATA